MKKMTLFRPAGTPLLIFIGYFTVFYSIWDYLLDKNVGTGKGMGISVRKNGDKKMSKLLIWEFTKLQYISRNLQVAQFKLEFIIFVLYNCVVSHV